MGKYNKKVKGKEKKKLAKLQEEFNPSARDPYIEKKRKSRDLLLEETEEDLKEAMKNLGTPIDEDEEDEE